MNRPSLPKILLLSHGWDYAEWTAFYPEDLPLDWRLGYFSNAFRGVLLPADLLQGGAGPEDLREEVHSGFVFLVPQGALSTQELDRFRAVLGAQFGGEFHGCDRLESLQADPQCRQFRLAADAPMDLMQIRQTVELLHQRGQPGQPALLLVDGDPPDFIRLQQCQTLLELMGLA